MTYAAVPSEYNSSKHAHYGHQIDARACVNLLCRASLFFLSQNVLDDLPLARLF